MAHRDKPADCEPVASGLSVIIMNPHADGYFRLLNIPISKFPLGEGGRPKDGGWIRLAEAESAKQVNMPMAELRYCGFAASILRLWRDPSPRACMLMDILTY